MTKKKKIIFLAPYPHGEAPSQRFRFEQYLDMLESNNFDIHFAPFLDSKTWYALYKEGGVFKKITGIIRSFLRDVLLRFFQFINMILFLFIGKHHT